MMRTGKIVLVFILFLILGVPDVVSQRIYDDRGHYIGRVDNNRYYDGRGRSIGRVDALIIPITTMSQPLQTVSYVDLERYSGLWYEIASYPQRFQRGCHKTTAEYTLSEKGYVIVKNRCNKDSIDGMQSSIKGKAFVQKNLGNAKLRVQFFWPFRGDYWIIDLADDYSYAVVSHPSRNYLWILSRTPVMDEKIYSGILERLKDKGFDLDRLQLTKQVQ